jgi:DNA-binding CsgD family transcriptional regulator
MRHCRWFADWCEQVGRGQHGMLFDPTHPHLPDVLAAFDWAFGESPPDAYRMSSGLGWVRNSLGHYAHIAREVDWVAGRDGADDPVGWAKAVSGLVRSLNLVLTRPDIPELVARARPLLPPDETVALRGLAVADAFGGLALADPTMFDEQLATAALDGDDLGLALCSASCAFLAIMLGRFDTVRSIARRLEVTLARHGARLDARSLAYPFVLQELLERGRTAELVTLRQRGGTPEPTGVGTLNIIDCFISDALDPELVTDVGQSTPWTDVPFVDYMMDTAQRAFRARRRGDLATAADLVGSTVRGYLFTPVLGAYLYRWLVLWSLAIHRRSEVDDPVERFVADAARVTDAPFAVARARQFEALVARYDGRRDDVRRHAHDMLAVSVANGFALSAVDALELVAETDADPARAARLFAAAVAERGRIGYVARMVPDPALVDELVDRLHDEQPDAWEQGATLSIAGAAEYAQRWRGERARPSHGWDSLTPMERKVVELVAGGASNDDVARQLVMSTATVKTHLTHVYAKTATANRTELGARWRDQGGT